MSIITIGGEASHEYPADVMVVVMTVHAEAPMSCEAVKCGTASVEKLLKGLESAGFEISRLVCEKESVSRRHSYNDNEVSYIFSKQIKMTTEVNMQVPEIVAEVITECGINAVYDVDFSLSSTCAYEDEVLKAALLDSRRKAELIAQTIGASIIGIEKASTERHTSSEREHERGIAAYAAGSRCVDSLAVKLEAKKFTIIKEIEVSWIIE